MKNKIFKPKNLLLFAVALTFFMSASATDKDAAIRLGLFTTEGDALTLLHLQTNLLIEGAYARYEHVQEYRNPYDYPIETSYYFPRTRASVFHKFEAEYQGKVLVGTVMEKGEAQDLYEKHKEDGDTVAYAEINSVTPDIMQIKIGNIPADEEVTIKFSIIEPLDIILNRFWAFKLVSTLSEKYGAYKITNPTLIANYDLVKPDDSEISGWDIDITIISEYPFLNIENPSHDLEPTLQTIDGQYYATWEASTLPNKDFSLYFETENVHDPRIILAEHPEIGGDYVLYTSFFPELNDRTSSEVIDLILLEDDTYEINLATLEDDTETAKVEFIFIIDRSGSMMGDRIESLKDALEVFIDNLPDDSYFNIISFGSEYEYYSSESIKNTASARTEAKSWTKSIDADFGGTEILEPVLSLDTLELIENYPRTVVILTDGAVYNEDQVIFQVHELSDRMQVCGVGIGYGVSDYLLRNIGIAGKCTTIFVTDEDNLAEKAMHIINAATSHYIQDVIFEANCYDSDDSLIYTRIDVKSYVLKNTPYVQYDYLTEVEDIDHCEVDLQYYNSFTENSHDNEYESSHAGESDSGIWHAIAISEKLQSMIFEAKGLEVGEDKVALESEIVEMSVKYNILTELTAFLLVIDEDSVDPDATVPIDIDAMQYDESAAGFSGGALIQSIITFVGIVFMMLYIFE